MPDATSFSGDVRIGAHLGESGNRTSMQPQVIPEAEWFLSADASELFRSSGLGQTPRPRADACALQVANSRAEELTRMCVGMFYICQTSTSRLRQVVSPSCAEL